MEPEIKDFVFRYRKKCWYPMGEDQDPEGKLLLKLVWKEFCEQWRPGKDPVVEIPADCTKSHKTETIKVPKIWVKKRKWDFPIEEVENA